MPPVNGIRWRDCRLDLDLSSENAAVRLGISGGHLRNVEGSHVVASDRLIRRAARLYSVDPADLVAEKKGADPGSGGNDGVPDTPPQQPKNEPKGPPTRRDGGGSGPPRSDRGAAA